MAQERMLAALSGLAKEMMGSRLRRDSQSGDDGHGARCLPDRAVAEQDAAEPLVGDEPAPAAVRIPSPVLVLGGVRRW